MLKEKDMEILSHLRNNARKKVTEISKKVKMPVTTIYDRLKTHDKKGIVKKHVALLDFSKLGYHATALVALKVANEKKKELQDYLSKHKNVNSLYRVNFDHDFLAEVIFEDVSKLQEFVDLLGFKFGVENPRIFNIINEIHKEKFLTNLEL
ncbi:Lrp/AsnC family transcriptional regulator [Candidatus Woesearchaeota archaeon]|nr:Lrp/AsnC family transcriptional regulator [Candidatus Woesearchaeota archaeon]